MSDNELTTESEPTSTTSDSSAKTSARPISLIMSLLVLLLVVVMAYFYYQDRQEIKRSYDLLTQQQSALAGQQQALIQELEQRLAGLKTELSERDAAQQATMKEMTDQLIASSERLAALNGQNQRSWYLDEAYYLLRIANNRIVFLQDLDTALALLEQADQLLARVEDVDLFSVRQKLAEDRQRLSAVDPVDQTGTAIRLGAIQARIDSLPLQRLLFEQETTTREPDAQATTWYEHLAQSMSKLGEQWFEVRKHSQGYNPLMTEAEAQQLRYVVLLTVQTAQFAVLHQDGALYQATLLQLRSRLSSYFDTEDPAVQMILAEITRLLDIPVALEPVAGLESLALMQSYRQAKRTADSETES